jgi:predicted nucleotidyltransferase/GNAT superfamily N-acetyltransferase
MAAVYGGLYGMGGGTVTLDESIQIMVAEISDILADKSPSIYLYGSVVLDDFKLGWSDIDILVLTKRNICLEQAETLVGLRQSLSKRYPENPYFRLFEGGIRSLGAFINNTPKRTVYWGTSGQRITDNYRLDSFSMAELIDGGRLLYGGDIRDRLTYTTYAELRDDVRKHYEAIRKYAQSTNKSIHSFGWLLDIARGIYTLRTGKIIAKTAAGEWALENGICPVPEALTRAVEVRRDPLAAKSDDGVLSYAGQLGGEIQKFADVLERELYVSDPCASLSTAFWKKDYYPAPETIEIIREKDFEKSGNSEYSRYFKLMHKLEKIGSYDLPNGYCYQTVNLPSEATDVADFINRCYGYSLTSDEILRWTGFPVYDSNLWVSICNNDTQQIIALGIADFDCEIGEGSLEWIQVSPDKRGLGFGAKIVNELLSRLSTKAKFVTVSGGCDNPTNPEKLYRKCGFVGDEIWCVVRKEV